MARKRTYRLDANKADRRVTETTVQYENISEVQRLLEEAESDPSMISRALARMPQIRRYADRDVAMALEDAAQMAELDHDPEVVAWECLRSQPLRRPDRTSGIGAPRDRRHAIESTPQRGVISALIAFVAVWWNVR